MTSLDPYLELLLSRGRSYFSPEEARAALDTSPAALAAAVTRLIKKHRLANPRHGFYLILRPEDRIAGAPDPARWIDPLMKHLQLDYRISQLRAAAFHGASHQAAMFFRWLFPGSDVISRSGATVFNSSTRRPGRSRGSTRPTDSTR